MLSVKVKNKNYFFLACLILFGLILIIRVFSLYTSPLFDTTETRYASIAQKIILDDDWVTLRLPPFNEPFLAKPPLSFWLVALSYKLFGSNEFSSRFPNFIIGLLIAIFTFLITRQLYDKRSAFLAPLILFSNIFFFIQAGTVSLDIMVCLTITGSMWSYLGTIKAIERGKKLQRFLYECSLGLFFGLGMLSKGPLILVLFFGSIILYALSSRKISYLVKPNWLIAFLICVLISLPWYLSVQKANPDFFSYFFLQEHIYRYLFRDYGDRYGNGHTQPYGMSWIFTLTAFMPWTFSLLPLGHSIWKNLKNKQKIADSTLFLLSWAILAPLFFTLARSILMTYIISSLPALSIICARVFSKYLHKLNEEPKSLIYKNNRISSFFFNPANSLIYIILAALVITAGVISYSSGMPYELPRITSIASVITLTLISFMVGFIASRNLRKRSYAFLALIMLGIPLIMSYWYGPLSTSISEIKSMKSIIEDLEEKVPDYRNKYIFFIGDNPPYSWYFYTQRKSVNDKADKKAFQNNILKPSFECSNSEKYKTHLHKKGQSFVVVTENHLQSFQEKYPYSFAKGLISKRGKYYIFELGQA